MNKTIFDFLTLKADVAFVYNTYTVRQIMEKMRIHRYNVIPVLKEDGTYYGTIADGDILNVICSFDFNKQIAEAVLLEEIAIHRSYKALDINTPLSEILKLSMEQNFIPILDDRGMFIGIIKRKSILNYFLAS